MRIIIIGGEKNLVERLLKFIKSFKSYWKLQFEVKLYSDYFDFIINEPKNKMVIITTDQCISSLTGNSAFYSIKRAFMSSQILHVTMNPNPYHFSESENQYVFNFISENESLEKELGQTLHQLYF